MVGDGAAVDAAFLDPPYNVRINGHANAKGRHREFAMASGEMSEAAFRAFLSETLGACASVSRDGAVHFVCMDWRHMDDVAAVGGAIYGDLLNLCVWNKSNAGMGSLYRSKHELVFVYRVGSAPHFNAVELGRHGRNRTNVWDYASVNSMAGSRREDLALHPTVKPTALVADAIQDVTRRGELVLDIFLGSGTTLIAAERTGRRFRGLDIDPAYVDVAIDRWSAMTGKEAAACRGSRQVSKPVGPAARRPARGSPRARAATRRAGRRPTSRQARLGLRHRDRQDAHRDAGRRAARGDGGGGPAAPDLPGRDRGQPLRPARGPEDDRQARAVPGGPARPSRAARSSAASSRSIPTTPTRRMLILGIAGRDPARQGPDYDGEQLLLEPWAVQAALSRRRGGQRLADKERRRDQALHPRCRYAALATADRRMSGARDGDDDAIGYRKPPASTRFRKGQSGNPRGRPRGRRNEPPYEAVLGQMVTSARTASNVGSPPPRRSCCT